ncbi:MAG: hypothetical protein PVH88_11500 [Ignavibacteria bacterium]|jgi:hypothetical protein
MIEIKISTNAAIILLTERMRYELKLRKRAGMLPSHSELETLGQKELLSIAETAASDLIFLLPAEILAEKNNLGDIIYRSIKSLSKVYNREEFNLYTRDRAYNLMKPTECIFKLSNNKDDFQYN